MKKIVVLAAFLCFVSTIAFAQEEMNIRFGFQLSPSFSWMTSNTNRINSSGTNLGIKLGMFGEFYFRENYAFVSGIGFHFNSGGTVLHEFGGSYWHDTDIVTSENPLSDMVKLKYSIQYVEIPALLKMRTKEFGYIRYYVEPGFNIGIKTQARGNVNDPKIGGIDPDEKFDIRKEVNPLNLSWGIGGGIEYSLSESTSLIAGLGLQFGFIDVNDDGSDEYIKDGQTLSENSNEKINSITLKLGIKF